MTLQLQNHFEDFEAPRFQSVPVTLFGRYMLESKSEYACQTVEMSPGDMLLFGPAKPNVGEKVIVYLDELGRFAGVATRVDGAGFAMSMNLPALKRDKLADQLTWFANRHAVGLPEDRRHERVVPLMRRANLRLADGREFIVKILDISLSGVGIETEVTPPLGSQVVVGTTPAVVVRHFPGGFAGEFTKPFQAGQVDESTRL
ncbi:PilZ domain-containing protein [Methylocystis heyeri]|uniref:PilZ domain-containing protein n=1 Tax=Methylocystis heyeri TaxID=391905 RepID=A0A6B8KG83_9HYPH|nr:PilZ domain-containing protein [Methylocystis heyeri]QGM45440.1 PilZ domain-containing protein [Methylocystis heyeri]